MTVKSGMSPVHPGVVLREELDGLGLSANALAKAIDVPANRVTAILNAERGITADTALRLGRYFDTTAQFWLNLQQAWQLRVAESESGSRILASVIPRQAEAVRIAARQATAANEAVAALPAARKLGSVLKVIEQSAALCDQISAVERAVRLSESNQRMLRALATPLDELRGIGALQTTFGRELQHTTQWLAEYEKRFRTANADDLSALLARLRATQPPSFLHRVAAMKGDPAKAWRSAKPSFVQRLAAMKNPWLDVQDELGSVKRILELQEVGAVIGSQATFSESAAAQIRNWLGDWRKPVAWPNHIWRDLAARADFYADLGFNADLTDLPPAAFREATEIAAIRSMRLSLVETHGPPAPSAPREEAAFARTNDAHDQLQRFESHLRLFIDTEMTRVFGREWPTHRLPNGMHGSWTEKKDAAARAGRPECVLIAYADFTDYLRIIVRKDNWRQVFGNHFERPEDLRESFQRLHPIRLDTMHARPISQDDELLLYVEIKRIMRVIDC